MAALDRLQKLLRQNSVTGIDFVYVHRNQTTLDLFFYRHDAAPQAQAIVGAVPPDQIRIHSAEGLPDVPVTSATWTVVDKRDGGSGWLGIVRHDGLEVRRMPLSAGRFFYVATYEENTPSDAFGGEYDAESATDACAFILGKGVFAERTNPVTAVAAMATADGFELAVEDAVSK